MKGFLFIAAILLLSQAQPAPTPMPSVDVGRLAGTWYIDLAFNSTFNSSNPLGITCWTWNLTISDDESTVTVLETYTQNSNPVSNTIVFDVSNNGSSFWIDSYNNTWVWVDVDIRDYNWGALAGDTQQYAYLVSRNANLSQNIIHDEILLLNWEEYSIDVSNYYMIENSDCTSISL